MAAGRPRKPTNLKVIEGNRGKRGHSSQEPDPDYLNDLTPPDWMPEVAKAVWNELAPQLRNARLLTRCDVVALEQACVAIAQYRLSVRRVGEELIKVRQPTDENPAGSEMINPWLLVQSMAHKQAMALLREFGMTPAARSRVVVNSQLDMFGNGKDGDKKDYFA